MARTRHEAIHSYITDMLALEEHIEKALKAQADEFENDHKVLGGELRVMLARVQGNISALRGMAAMKATDANATQAVGDMVKRAASMMAGLGAAAIDLVRTEKLPKDLRDDYTAFSLAYIGYLMLFTTARSLEDGTTASVAQRHMAGYAQMLMSLNRLIPGTVLDLLTTEGLAGAQDVREPVSQAVNAAWSAAGSDSSAR